MAFKIESPSFKNGERIPIVHTGDGEDASPPLRWSDAPQGTKAFALLCDDPDAPMGTWVHWVMYSIPPERAGLEQGVPTKDALPGGVKQGTNSWGRIGYGGPSPPRGKPHRYFFKLYALDARIETAPGATKEALLKSVQGHVLAQAELVGLYGR